jgi:hypothetical protein
MRAHVMKYKAVLQAQAWLRYKVATQSSDLHASCRCWRLHSHLLQHLSSPLLHSPLSEVILVVFIKSKPTKEARSGLSLQQQQQQQRSG